MPRNDLSLSNKIALLDKIKSQPINTSYRRLAEITGVPKSTISRILQQETQLREEFELQEGQTGSSKRKREGKDPDVEEALYQWFSIVRDRGVNINGPILKAKSEVFAKKLGRNDFKPTDGWLSRWKARHDITFKKRKESSEQWKIATTTGLLTIDNNDIEDCEDWIVENIKCKHEKLYDDDEPPVTNQEAKQCIAVLQRYFMQEGNEGSPAFALDTCADFVEYKCRKKQKTDKT